MQMYLLHRKRQFVGSKHRRRNFHNPQRHLRCRIKDTIRVIHMHLELNTAICHQPSRDEIMNLSDIKNASSLAVVARCNLRSLKRM